MSEDDDHSGADDSGRREAAVTLDVRGLRCPLPVLRARKALQDLDSGRVLTVLATDPAAVIDFPHFCHQAGLDLLSARRDGDVLVFEIRKPVSGMAGQGSGAGVEEDRSV